ncbi:MAG: transporter [Cyanobacteriota bacterium]|nr:transporter [Cyanobacteriota bacterium]
MSFATLLMLFIKTSLITLMISLGLGLRLPKLAEHQHRPGLVLRVVLGSCVLVPLVALVMLKLPISQQMSPGARLGIALMALSPSAPLTLRKAGVRGGDAHLAAVMQVAAAVVAVVSIPLLSDLFRTVFQVRGWQIQPGPVALQVGLVQVLPLSVGLLLGHWRPELATRWAAPLQKMALLMTLAVVGLILCVVLPQLLTFALTNALAIAAMGGMTAAALGIGYGLGGGAREERLTTALVTSMRNPGLALLFAVSHGPDVPGVKLAIVTYLLMTVVASVPFLRWANQTSAP